MGLYFVWVRVMLCVYGTSTGCFHKKARVCFLAITKYDAYVKILIGRNVVFDAQVAFSLPRQTKSLWWGLPSTLQLFLWMVKVDWI